MAYKDGSRIKGGRAYRQSQGFKKFIRERDNYTCQICGQEGWIIDHIVPYAISHETRPDGVRCLCHSCNLKLRRPRRDACLALLQWFAHIEEEIEANGRTITVM